jgi:hypothetical protein
MAFFKEAPIKSLTRDRDAAKANFDRLAAELAEAEAATISTKQTAVAAVLAGDKIAGSVAKTAHGAALIDQSTSQEAFAEARKMLAFLDESIATMADQKTRAATAAASNELAVELIEAHAAYHASTSALNEICSRVLAVTQEANGMAVFLTSSLIEVGLAAPIVAEHLRLHARAVLNHQAAAVMPKPAPEPVKVIAPAKPPLTQVFVTRAVRWKDHDGFDRCSAKFLDAEMPPRAAAYALKVGAALPMNSPERKNKGSWPTHVTLNNCFDLDKEETGTAPPSGSVVEPTIHSAFQPLPGLRAPFQLKIAAGGA